jgi:sugar phosphate isomerase/epimerase
MSFNRRTFLQLGMTSLAATALPASVFAKSNSFFEQHKLPIGLQLYTVGDLARSDLAGTLKKIAGIGYQTIELAGFHAHKPAEVRAAADAAGLKLTSIHVGAQLRDNEPSLSGDLARLAADVHTLGATHVVMPFFIIPERMPAKGADEAFPAYIKRILGQMTVDDWKHNAAFLNEKSLVLKREGLQLGYHNHNCEFAPVGNTTGFDIIAGETDPGSVTLEMDVGWVRAAGLDPIAVLKRYPKRFQLMHVKDVRASTQNNFALSQDPTEVGRGIIDWKALLPAAYASGVRKFFVEQEPPFEKDRFASIADSFKYLSA